MKYDKYLPEQYVFPFWCGDTVINESVLPLENENGEISPIPLLYRAEEILEVRSAGLDTLYAPGRDYLLSDGRLCVIPGGAIKTTAFDEYYLNEEIQGKCFSATRGGYIYFSEGSGMHEKQLAVTYRHSDKWSGEIPADKTALLPHTAEKLRNGEKLNILVFGDSISTGANSSGVVNAPPFAEDWCSMTVRGLASFYNNNKITLINKAVGGTVSEWGAKNAGEAAKCLPELAIIGFGMNDGSGRVPPCDYEKNIKSIINTISEANEGCEFILIVTSLANREVKGFFGLQEEYLPIILNMQRTGTAVADMTGMHRELLSHKRFFDMSGNNVNHPNDFLARAYAQCILASLGCK